MNNVREETRLRQSIKRLIIFFIAGLVLSGVTAFPMEAELNLLSSGLMISGADNVLVRWVEQVYRAIHQTNRDFPFLAYGTDWLAFAHIVIAINFLGPLKDPVKNVWVIQFGIIACIAIFPLAFIAGAVRKIPVYWRIIDCSFGVLGGLLLWYCLKQIRRLESLATLVD
jgi:hypothetical protein